jgi:hypothetical protein
MRHGFFQGAALSLGLAAGLSAAQVTEIYKCTDDRGRPLYTSDRRDTVGKKCELVSREVNSTPGPKAAAKSPAGFPRESGTERASARERQRQILEQELKSEEDQLAQARKALAEQDLPRSGEDRGSAKTIERLQPYRDNIELHEKNLDALRRELNNLNR